MTLFAGSLEDASRLVVYDGASGNELWRIPFDHGYGLAFSSDGALIASPHPTKRMVQLFDALRIVPLDSMECPPADYECEGGVHVASLPHERGFLTATFSEHGGSIFEWNATHGLMRSLPPTDDTILRIATSPTGDWFTMDLADLATGERTVLVREYPSAEKKCSWSGVSSAPIGQQNMAAVATGEEIIIYNVETCQPAYSLNGKQPDVAADPAGRVLAAMTTDFQLTLYDLQTQQPGPTGKVSSSSSSHRLVRMAFNRDGSLLAIAQDSDLHILRILP